ncbi:hypothetical protein [Atlantibacter sp.]|nr:hypothetical protein [Atlantibacter sp.]
MNKPDDVLPKGDFGVENVYAGIRPHSRNIMDIETGTVRPRDFQEIKRLQWEMPEPKSDSQLAKG